MIYRLFLFVFAIVIVFGCRSGDEDKNDTNVVDFKTHSFDIDEVKLLDGPFKHANELNVKVLLNYEPDRFLATFRKEAGLEPKAERYGGWESSSIAGHSLGHYLSANAMMYQSTGRQEFLENVNYIVDELAMVQEANEDRYIGAFPEGKKVFEQEIAWGEIRASSFDLNGIWAPWYTHHKVLAGLRDAHTLCENDKALEVALSFADWIGSIVGDLPHETVQEMLKCEYGGMNEVLADLYGFTGDEKYLDLSRVFHDEVILDSLAAGVDVLPGKHANTQIPKVIGLARRYELTGNETEKESVLFFWDRVVNHHSYVTGSNALNEYFGPAGQLSDRLGPHTGETCNVYNMLKLSDHLFKWNASPEVADFYERALFNHILASQHPENGRVTYHINIDQGGYKHFQDPHAFTCCIGTGMENHAKYNENIYYYNDTELFVSQYIASELTWKDKSLILRQETGYPEEQGSRFVIDTQESEEFTLKLRYPEWAEKGFEVMINGQACQVDETPGSFVDIARKWESGDIVEVSFPFSLRAEPMPDDPDRISLVYGPLVLAGEIGPVDDPNAYDLDYVPFMVTDDRNPNHWVDRMNDENNLFRTDTGVSNPRSVDLYPFHEAYDCRYSVYWDLVTDEEWNELNEQQKKIEESERKLEERTIDFFQPGDIDHERSHYFEGPQSTAHQFRDRRYRVTLENGWFSFKMKVLPNQPNILNVEYWGEGYESKRSFDIEVEGERIASEDITDRIGEKFYNREYDIPEELTRGKKEVTVHIRAQARRIAGPVYGVRTVKED